MTDRVTGVAASRRLVTANIGLAATMLALPRAAYAKVSEGQLEVELTRRGVIRKRRRIETMISVRRPTKESKP